LCADASILSDWKQCHIRTAETIALHTDRNYASRHAVNHAAERWSDLVSGAIQASEDPATLAKWASLVAVSIPTLRTRCYAAHVSPKRSLDLARLLRVCVQARRECCSPTDLLDTKDPRTVSALLVRAGLSDESHRWGSPIEILSIQKLVTVSSPVDALKHKLQIVGTDTGAPW
jgi:hypothetical protein